MGDFVANGSLPGTESSGSEEIKGFGGWLRLVLFELVLVCAIGIKVLIEKLPTLPARLADIQAGSFISAMRLVFVSGMIAFAITCLVRFLQKKKDAPYLTALLFVPFIAGSAHEMWLHGLDHQPIKQSTVIGLMAMGATIGYLLRSKRVKNTFVR